MKDRVGRLVVLGSTLSALAIVRNCARLGLECYVVDSQDGPASGSRLAKFVRVDDRSDDSTASTVELLGAESHAALIADSDSWLRWIVEKRQRLSEAFATILHPSNTTVRCCLDKTAFLKACAEYSLPAPRLFSFGSVRDVRFPALVRPTETRHGKGNRIPKAIEVGDVMELDALLKRYRDCGAAPTLCQSLLRPNLQQFSVGFARNDKGASKVFVAEKLRPSAVRCAGGTYVVASPDNSVACLASRALECFDFFGMGEVEILSDPDSGKMHIVEINVRPWVQYALARKCGFDFLRFLLNPDSYKDQLECPNGGAWINFADDLYVVFSRSEGMITQRQLRFLDYVKSLLSANAFAKWSWSDPGPAMFSNR